MTQEIDIPDDCQLTEDELAERKPHVEEMIERVEDVEEVEDGFRFTFPGDPETLELLTTFARNERACCPTGTYELAFSGPEEPVTFTMGGPEEMKHDAADALGVDCC